MLKNISLHQPIKFKRSETGQWESGSMYIQINSNEFVIKDSNLNNINPNTIYDFVAAWYGDINGN